MRITERDIRLTRDIALSHVMSRDQACELYFGSVTRTNTRLRELGSLGMVKSLRTPFFAQKLYCVGPNAGEILGERIGALAAARTGSPRFIQHALCVTNVRLALGKRGMKAWRFEPQLRCIFEFANRRIEVRPDGMGVFESGAILIEADLGHVTPSKFREKLLGFHQFVTSGECQRRWGFPTITLLVITTGKRRASTLAGLAPEHPAFRYEVKTMESLGIKEIGAWS